MNKNHKHSDESLKGTFVSVLLLGAFIAVSWIGVYVLFIARG
ncbi:cytochrome c oxidase subunit 2A [Paenibacillus sp. 1_12]|nr:cytochrome c oxidase subunit 2A [Paenibacillus sp. 1_12]